MPARNRVSTSLALFVLIIISPSLTSCQAFVLVSVSTLPATQLHEPTATSASPPHRSLLFDATHKAEAITPPNYVNGNEIVLPAQSVMLYIFK